MNPSKAHSPQNDVVGASYPLKPNLSAKYATITRGQVPCLTQILGNSLVEFEADAAPEFSGHSP